VDLSIVIVNWNSLSFLKTCVSSIAKYTSNISYEIIVIDNASYDGCAEYCTAALQPGVRFIQAERNEGFAKANNFAYKEAAGRCVLFLNPDTEVRDNAFGKMFETLTNNDSFGAIGCMLLNADGSVQTSSIFPFPTIFNQIFDFDFFIRHFGKYGYMKLKPLYSTSEKPWPVDALSGACIMVKKEVFDQVGGFSADYFMYSEDIDLCKKIALKGSRTAFLNSVSLFHFGGGATGKQPVKKFGTVMMSEAKWLYFRKFNGRTYAFLYKTLYGIIALMKVGAGGILLLLFIWNKTLRKSALGTFGKNIYIVSWSIGKEKWIKNQN
jgi:Predicted glycosyltransferases